MPAHLKVSLRGKQTRIADDRLHAFQHDQRRYLEPQVRPVIKVYEIADTAENGDRLYREVGQEPLPVRRAVRTPPPSAPIPEPTPTPKPTPRRATARATTPRRRR